MTRMAVVLLCAAAVVPAAAENLLLFDFEADTGAWENESPTPVLPQLLEGRARRGNMALAFTHRFSPAAKILHCRVTEGFPRDVTNIDGFQGFSAWVFIPNGKPAWEAKMFVRSGEGWDWAEGPTLRRLQPGWHRVEVPAERIKHPADLRDIGVEVINFSEEIESTILIDAVEAVIVSPLPVGP